MFEMVVKIRTGLINGTPCVVTLMVRQAQGDKLLFMRQLTVIPKHRRPHRLQKTRTEIFLKSLPC